MKRREFVQWVSTGIWAWQTGRLALEQLAEPDMHHLVILHTNDWHSRIEPFPMDGSRNQGLGGASKRAALIRQIRAESEHVLLLDSGDIFQGTPYFNYFAGELEFKLMTEMGYDAATLGNHDFDAGLENLATQMNQAGFDMLCANYRFGHHDLRDRVLPFRVYDRGGLRVGVFGLGIELNGLVPDTLYGDTVYLDPIAEGNRIAEYLRNKEKCDLVICLSHLGYRYETEKISDRVLAARSRHIDIILGGHTHTFMKEPEHLPNLDGKPVLINQVGWAGILLGRIDLHFGKWSGWRRREVKKITVGG